MSIQIGGVRDLIKTDLMNIAETTVGSFEDLLYLVLRTRTSEAADSIEDLLRVYLHSRLSITDDGAFSTPDLWMLHLKALGATRDSIDGMVAELRGVGTSLFPVLT